MVIINMWIPDRVQEMYRVTKNNSLTLGAKGRLEKPRDGTEHWTRSILLRGEKGGRNMKRGRKGGESEK